MPIADDHNSWTIPPDLRKPAPIVDEAEEEKKREQYRSLQKLFNLGTFHEDVGI